MSYLNKKMAEVETKARSKAHEIAEKVLAKKAGSTAVIAAAILLVITVLLLITFKGKIEGWLTSLVSRIDTLVSNFTS